MKRLRLMKVVVQPIFVVDDGETLAEQNTPPIEVTAANWPAFADRLEGERATHEERLNAPPEPPETT